ncbi:hypothetical protein DXT76_00300 [Halobacillus trueperi]|uniref:Uncharacterized protein n=1 Tax=Halobacillus trueperi TaxID=156205 RepID=A0A3D8VTH9_9BACI|nr:hypothetical protein [Halobacillus trueperi]RDY72742.1 hypothetical protein DXT76_00300 [Halobacillus trueperi]
MSDSRELTSMIHAYHQQTQDYLNQMKELLQNAAPSTPFISYFTYSLSITHGPSDENLCLGSFHIQNFSSHPVTNPYLCIKLSEGAPFSFSGRFVYDESKMPRRAQGGWKRLNERENKEEYWLQPLEQSTIPPGQTLTFPNFQIRWTSEDNYAGSISGFVYCEENTEGAASLNSINLNGAVPKEVEPDDGSEQS